MQTMISINTVYFSSIFIFFFFFSREKKGEGRFREGNSYLKMIFFETLKS